MNPFASPPLSPDDSVQLTIASQELHTAPAEMILKCAFPSGYNYYEIQGAHGTFFGDINRPSLVQAIRNALSWLDAFRD
jgi:hypothetical protein